MFKGLQNENLWRRIGIVIVGGLAIWAWLTGWFPIIFYFLGLYAAIYIVSYTFKTTAIATFLISIGGIILYFLVTVAGLYLLYSVLTIMFTESFLYGLLLLVLLSIFGGLLYFIPMAVGFVLGYPLFFIIEDIEKRFEDKLEVISSHPESQKNVYSESEISERIYDSE